MTCVGKRQSTKAAVIEGGRQESGKATSLPMGLHRSPLTNPAVAGCQTAFISIIGTCRKNSGTVWRIIFTDAESFTDL